MTDVESLQIRLNFMAKLFQGWIDFNTASYVRENMSVTEDTKLFAPPEWPSHGTLKAWVTCMEEAAAALSGSPQVEAGRCPVCGGDCSAANPPVWNCPRFGDAPWATPDDKAFLRDLAQRLMNVPVMYGVDGGDIDRLAEIARALRPREQEGGEAPVAWAVYTPEGKMLLLSASKETTEAYPQYGHRVVPLFAHPPLPADGWKEGASVRVEHDGFQGTIIGRYRRLDGYEGAVVQQDGTKVVHVYGLRHLLPTPPASTEGGADA